MINQIKLFLARAKWAWKIFGFKYFVKFAILDFPTQFRRSQVGGTPPPSDRPVPRFLKNLPPSYPMIMVTIDGKTTQIPGTDGKVMSFDSQARLEMIAKKFEGRELFPESNARAREMVKGIDFSSLPFSKKPLNP